jgi:hypothetical protein
MDGLWLQVKAAYKYQAEDVDELNFEVGEIIQVVEYDDPDEQVLDILCTNHSIRGLCRPLLPIRSYQ